MEEKQRIDPQPGRIAQFTAIWQTLDKKKWATIGGTVVTLGALVIAGLRKGVSWSLSHKQ